MNGKPTLFLPVGQPGAGKTTLAKRLEVDHDALRLAKDEWFKAFYVDDAPDRASDVIEGRLIAIGLRGLALGCSVVLDFGLWTRDERSALRHAADERGAAVAMHYLDVPLEERVRRTAQRYAATPHETWPLTERDLVRYSAGFEAPTAAEIAGSEPIDSPPEGFETWDAWRAARWPTSLGAASTAASHRRE